MSEIPDAADVPPADLPVVDHHMHLDPVNGQGVEAAETFARAGGTHLFVLNKPSWSFTTVTDAGDFRVGFDHTVSIARAADDVVDGRAWPVLGVHPALVSRLLDRGYEPEGARDLMRAGLDVAAEYVTDGPAIALKSGRPHYDVAPEVRDASNEVIRHAFRRGAAADCPVQLHTESGETFPELAEWADDAGLGRDRAVKHYAEGPIEGPVASVIARKEPLRAAVEADTPFAMETDFIDDPDRPGAVLGPRTVPRRARWLREAGHGDALRTAFVRTPARVYGLDTLATLDRAAD